MCVLRAMVGEETVQRNHVSEEGRKKGLLRRNSANTEPLFISFFNFSLIYLIILIIPSLSEETFMVSFDGSLHKTGPILFLKREVVS